MGSKSDLNPQSEFREKEREGEGENVARSAEVEAEGPRHDGRRSEEGSETSGVSGQQARRPSAPAPRISLPHVPRRRPLPRLRRSARLVRFSLFT